MKKTVLFLFLSATLAALPAAHAAEEGTSLSPDWLSSTITGLLGEVLGWLEPGGTGTAPGTTGSCIDPMGNTIPCPEVPGP